MASERPAASSRTAQWAADQQRYTSLSGHTKGKKVTSNAVRCLSFSESSNRSSKPRSQFNFYGGTTAQKSIQNNYNSCHWQPGEVLPTSSSTPRRDSRRNPVTVSPISRSPAESRAVMCLLTEMQQTLSSVKEKVTGIDTRIENFEMRQSVLEKEVAELKSTGHSLPTKSDTRSRIVPPALASQIRRIHNSFDPDKQFKQSEPITSQHNARVIEKIKNSVKGDYSDDLIKRGCRNYKKTISARTKVTTPVKKKKYMRSLKQRSYERRTRMVRKGKEAKFWEDVKPEFMSDEEKVSDNTYIRHPPLYRSDRFTRFLMKLDERANKTLKKHARFERREGSPHDISPPDGTKLWMLKHDLSSEQATETDQEEEVEEDTERDASNDSETELFD